MVNRDQARSLVEAMIADHELPDGDECVVVDDYTIEKASGWVFFYQSRRFIETGEFSSQLAGNAPIIVNARTGTATVTGTAHPIEHYIAEYESRHGLR